MFFLLDAVVSASEAALSNNKKNKKQNKTQKLKKKKKKTREAKNLVEELFWALCC